MEHELVDAARVAEAHFDLRRVHVHVHAARVELEEQQVGGLALAVQLVAIGFAHRVRQHPVAHEAAVDVQVLRVGAGARRLRRARHAVEAQRPRLRVDREARIEEFASEQRRGALADGLRPQVRRYAPVVLERESHVGARQRDAPEGLLAVAELGLLGAQELLARGRVEVEVLDQHRGTGRARGGLRKDAARGVGADAAALGADRPGVACIFCPAGNFESRH